MSKTSPPEKKLESKPAHGNKRFVAKASGTVIILLPQDGASVDPSFVVSGTVTPTACMLNAVATDHNGVNYQGLPSPCTPDAAGNWEFTFSDLPDDPAANPITIFVYITQGAVGSQSVSVTVTPQKPANISLSTLNPSNATGTITSKTFTATGIVAPPTSEVSGVLRLTSTAAIGSKPRVAGGPGIQRGETGVWNLMFQVDQDGTYDLVVYISRGSKKKQQAFSITVNAGA